MISYSYHIGLRTGIQIVSQHLSENNRRRLNIALIARYIFETVYSSSFKQTRSELAVTLSGIIGAYVISSVAISYLINHKVNYKKLSAVIRIALVVTGIALLAFGLVGVRSNLSRMAILLNWIRQSEGTKLQKFKATSYLLTRGFMTTLFNVGWPMGMGATLLRNAYYFPKDRLHYYQGKLEENAFSAPTSFWDRIGCFTVFAFRQDKLFLSHLLTPAAQKLEICLLQPAEANKAIESFLPLLSSSSTLSEEERNTALLENLSSLYLIVKELEFVSQLKNLEKIMSELRSLSIEERHSAGHFLREKFSSQTDQILQNYQPYFSREKQVEIQSKLNQLKEDIEIKKETNVAPDLHKIRNKMGKLKIFVEMCLICFPEKSTLIEWNGFLDTGIKEAGALGNRIIQLKGQQGNNTDDKIDTEDSVWNALLMQNTKDKTSEILEQLRNWLNIKTDSEIDSKMNDLKLNTVSDALEQNVITLDDLLDKAAFEKKIIEEIKKRTSRSLLSEFYQVISSGMEISAIKNSFSYNVFRLAILNSSLLPLYFSLDKVLMGAAVGTIYFGALKFYKKRVPLAGRIKLPFTDKIRNSKITKVLLAIAKPERPLFRLDGQARNDQETYGKANLLGKCRILFSEFSMARDAALILSSFVRESRLGNIFPFTRGMLIAEDFVEWVAN